MTRAEDDEITGNIGFFSTPNKVFGWLLVHDREEPICVQAKYCGKLVGTGEASRLDVQLSQYDRRIRYQFVVKLTIELTIVQARSDNFQVFAKKGNDLISLEKTKLFHSNTRPSQQPANAGRDILIPEIWKLGELPDEVGATSEDGSVMIGQDGYIFLIGGSNEVAQLYHTTNDSAVEQWYKILTARVAACEQMGVAFLQLFVPEKQTILSKYYPASIQVPSPLYRGIKEAVARDRALASKVIFLDDLVGNGFAPEKVFKKTDSHLTSEANRVLFDASVKKLMGKHGQYEIAGSRSHRQTWDLAKKFASIESTESVDFFNGICVNNVDMHPTLVEENRPTSGVHLGTRCVYKNESAPIKKKVAGFANSFFFQEETSLGQIWWYSRLFRECHFLWTPNMVHEQVRKIRPDIVVCQTIERFLWLVPSQ